MRSYLLSALCTRFGSGELAPFCAEHGHAWVVWEPGAWTPPRIAFGGTPTFIHPSDPDQALSPAGAGGGDALAMGLVPRAAWSRQVTLGRTAGCDFAITDATVSQVHLVFSRLGTDTWYVRDAESTNGSWIGDDRLPPGVPRALADRVRLRAGNVKLTFHTPEGLFARLKKRSAEAPTLAAGA